MNYRVTIVACREWIMTFLVLQREFPEDFYPKMGEISKMFITGKIFALPVKTLFTGKLVNQFYRFLPVFTGKNAQLYAHLYDIVGFLMV